MINVLISIAAAGAGYLLGTLGTRRAVDEQVDARLAEFEARMGAAAPAAPPAPAPAAPPPTPAIAEPAAAPAPLPAAAAPEPVEEELSPETIAVLTSAICAFLGKPARIRRVRRVQPGFNPWAQQGRVTVMASHALRG